MQNRRPRGFTLIELLIVIAIIGILATFMMTALSAAKRKAQITVAKSHINAIKAALASYETDMGRYPRLSPIPDSSMVSGASNFYDDAPALYAALRNQPGRGGGPNAPYLQDWKHEDIGVASSSIMDKGAIKEAEMGQIPDTFVGKVERISKEDGEEINDLKFQLDHDPSGTGNPLVLLDPWGNPFHYREWASVRRSVKNAISASSSVKDWDSPDDNGGDPVPVPAPGGTLTVRIRARNPESFDIWSNGANQVNEMGHPDSDDVTSWR